MSTKLKRISPLTKDKPLKRSLLNEEAYKHFFNEGDPIKAIKSGKLMAKAWAKTLKSDEYLGQIHSFIYCTIASYWRATHKLPLKQCPLPAVKIAKSKIDASVLAIADAVGNAAAQLDIISSTHILGNLYTAILPENIRSTNGVFYTPPALANRLIQMSENAGVKWDSAKVVDPACGSGAFLVPIALNIARAIKKKGSNDQLNHIENHLLGYELDSFGAWLCQVFVEVALKDVIKAAGRRLNNIVKICDSLYLDEISHFDLVIGNPPYGKIKLTKEIKNRFASGLYGHPNLYGLFTDLAISLAKPSGIISYLTPTSFLSGEYFKNLRKLIRTTSSPLEMDFVSVRKGVFEDVLQETVLATYRKNGLKVVAENKVKVNEVINKSEFTCTVHHLSNIQLPSELNSPWIFPKKPEQIGIVEATQVMNTRLKDWGYKISTGQLVWNRYKPQLSARHGKKSYPIIWSEAISQDGSFILRSEKKNHLPWFNFVDGDEYLLTSKQCVLLHRTTSKEQEKRLIAAVLPSSLLQKGKRVIIENHLNMVLPFVSNPPVNLETLTIFLNSKAANEAFKAISGSVAVSAYELEALPIPEAKKMVRLTKLIADNETKEAIETECLNLYLNK